MCLNQWAQNDIFFLKADWNPLEDNSSLNQDFENWTIKRKS